MEYLTISLTLLLAYVLFQCFTLLRRNNRKFPPGPIPLPIIGNLHLLGNQPHKSLANLAKVHGPIMSLRLGQKTTIVISSSSIAKEVFQKQDLAINATRAIPGAVQIDNFYTHSVVWLPVSPQWRILRKFLTTNVFASNRLDATQHIRHAKIQELVAICQRSSEIGEAIDIGEAVYKTSTNIISNIAFSKDLVDPSGDSGTKEFKELLEGMMKDAAKPNLVDYFPILKSLDPHGLKRNNSIRVQKLLKLFDGFVNERLEQRKNSKKSSTDDVLDALLTAMENNPQEISRKHVPVLCLDLFLGGADTNANIVEWAMAEILKATPEVINKAQAELAEVAGEGKTIEEAHISQLPFLQCIVKETLRLHPSAPLLVPRKVEQDVEVCGRYTIQKNSEVFINVWAISRDSSFWDDPMVFNPERFMDSKLDVRGQDFELIPFSAGRRICPGMPLAIRMISIMLGTLLNTFKWKLEGEAAPKDLDMEDKYGLTLSKLHPLRAIPLPLRTPKVGFQEKAMAEN